VNSGHEAKLAGALQRLVPAVVGEARARIVRSRREHVAADLMKRARSETRRLDQWEKQSLALIEEQEREWAKKGKRIPSHVQANFGRERDHIARVRRDHEQLLKSLQASGEPYVRLAAVFSGE
jgi:hypothetical protein